MGSWRPLLGEILDLPLVHSLIQIFQRRVRQPNIWPNICRKLHEYGPVPTRPGKAGENDSTPGKPGNIVEFRKFEEKSWKSEVKPGKTGWVLKVPPLPPNFQIWRSQFIIIFSLTLLGIKYYLPSFSGLTMLGISPYISFDIYL